MASCVSPPLELSTTTRISMNCPRASRPNRAGQDAGPLRAPAGQALVDAALVAFGELERLLHVGGEIVEHREPLLAGARLHLVEVDEALIRPELAAADLLHL